MFGDYLDWEPVLEPLAKKNRVIAIDLPGFGDSAKPRREYSAEFFVSTLEEFFRQLQVTKPILAGNSFGGQVAMLYTLARPENVSKLVLVNSGGFWSTTQEQREMLARQYSETSLAGLTPGIHGLLFSRVFMKPSEMSSRYLEKQNAKLQRADFPAYAYALSSSIRLSLETYLVDRVGEIQCPTLLIWGDGDPVLPVEQGELALTRLPNAQLKRIIGCGHAPQMECPAGFMHAIRDFLDR